MTERELIDAIQANKAEMVKYLKQLIAIQKAADRAEAQNAVFLTLAELNVWHGKATERLFTNFPEFSSEVVLRGPGR